VSVDRVKGAFETIVVRVAESALVELVPKQRNMLSDFLTLLSKWNDRVNLVSRKDFEGVVKDRLFDALVLWREFGPWTGMSHLDIGSGGGFPAIPIHIMSPEENLTLMEPRYRRVSFLSTVAAHLELDHVEIRQERLEHRAGDTATPGTFDVVTAQAVEPLAKMLPLVLTKVAEGGRFVWMRSGKMTGDELNVMHQCEGRWQVAETTCTRPTGESSWVGSVKNVV